MIQDYLLLGNVTVALVLHSHWKDPLLHRLLNQ
jgi:hypothetical protein